jgi:hypothetical protein
MAGDWIKMRTNLAGDPAVKAMARALKLDVFSVVGRLHSFWSWADQHTEDGALVLTELEDVDEVVGRRGFAEEMVRVGWLLPGQTQGVEIPNWLRHNGDSAKKRCLDMDRQRAKRSRSGHDVVTDVSRTERDETRTESGRLRDQRREEKSNTPVVPLSGDGEGAGSQGESGESAELVLVPEDGDPPPGNTAGQAGDRLEPIAVELQRARAMFRMRESTPLDMAQIRAWRRAHAVVKATTPEEWAVLEAYYSAELAKRDDFRRRDVVTCLNNWSGEVTRAHAWASASGFRVPEISAKKEKGAAGPEGWREVLQALYPEADTAVYAGWRAVPESLKEEVAAVFREAERGRSDEGRVTSDESQTDGRAA